MELYLAPMEGITGYIVRNAFMHNFPGIDKYFTPFIPAAKRLNHKTERDLAPENNKGLHLVPQLISNDADETLEMIRMLKDRGFTEFNINLGCPSGTVAGKRRGSGLLLYPDDLDRFLDGLYSRADVPVSIKTRIGYNGVDEWPQLLKIFSRYPASELIIHPRIKKEQYSGFVHLDAFSKAYDLYRDTIETLCYNGDIWNIEKYHELISRFPAVEKIMIGRGLLSRPFLARQIKGLPVNDPAEKIRSFCEEIYDGYMSVFDGEKDAVMHMKEIWANLGASFSGSEKLIKKLMKCQSAADYKAITGQIFSLCPVLPEDH